MYNCNVGLTLKSGNAKTGPIPASIIESSTCFEKCAFFKECYAKAGSITRFGHWARVDQGRGTLEWSEYCDAVSKFKPDQVWRHAVAGDLPGPGGDILARPFKALVRANSGRPNIAYTHKNMKKRKNRELVRYANAEGFTVNLSANNLDHADWLFTLNIGPVAAVVDTLADETPKKQITAGGLKAIKCPNVDDPSIQCTDCKLCAIAARDFVIVFPVHGARKKGAAEASRGFSRW